MIKRCLTLFLLSIFSFCSFAQDYEWNEGSFLDDLHGSVGVGAAMVPWFPGAADYRILPLPLINIIYKDRYYAAVNGVGLQFQRGNFFMGPRLMWDNGRYKGGHTKNMPNLAGSLDFGPFVKYVAWPFVFTVDMQKALTTAGHESIFGNAQVAYNYKVNDYFNIVTTAKVKLAAQRYMDAYFGVSEKDSIRSGFKEYKPTGGIYNSGITIASAYSYFDPWNWFGSVGMFVLGPQAADSDVVQKRMQFSAFTGLSYRF